jgi:hypothetical protein
MRLNSTSSSSLFFLLLFPFFAVPFFLLSTERTFVCSEQTHTHKKKKAIGAVAVDISPFFFFLFFSLALSRSLHGINYPKEEKKRNSEYEVSERERSSIENFFS